MITRTYVTLDVSPATFKEILDKLKAAGYHHAFTPKTLDDEVEIELIDMHGIALTKEDTPDAAAKTRSKGSRNPRGNKRRP